MIVIVVDDVILLKVISFSNVLFAAFVVNGVLFAIPESAVNVICDGLAVAPVIVNVVSLLPFQAPAKNLIAVVPEGTETVTDPVSLFPPILKPDLLLTVQDDALLPAENDVSVHEISDEPLPETEI